MNLDERIRGVFKRKEQGIAFAIDVYGDIYIGKNYDELETIGKVVPLIVTADDCNSVEEYKQKIINKVELLSEYLDYYANLDNEREYKRMLKVREIYCELTKGK